jgi:hypothetical protein
MRAPSDHMKTLRRRVDFLKSREHKNSFDLAELGALEWAIVNLQTQPAPVQEPVWIQPDHLQKAQTAPFLCRVEPHKRDDFVPLYPTPPAAQRQWVGLTQKQKAEIAEDWAVDVLPDIDHVVACIEAKLKEKNT